MYSGPALQPNNIHLSNKRLQSECDKRLTSQSATAVNAMAGGQVVQLVVGVLCTERAGIQQALAVTRSVLLPRLQV